MSTAISPAATVILLRDSDRGPEIFMVRRHERTAFMGGAHVFPGGRVEPADVESAGGDDALAFRLAAMRELFEEAGVLLARDTASAEPGGDAPFVSLAGRDVQNRFREYRADVYAGRMALADLAAREHLALAPGALVPLAHWVTPPVDTRRFDTRFFVTRVPPEQTPVHDATETTHGVWTTPAEALARDRRDEIVLPPPTWTTLRELEPFATVDAVLRWAARRTIARREPLFREHAGQRLLLLPGDPLNPEGWHEPVLWETRFIQSGGRWRAARA